MLTGNYGFFNILVILLCLFSFDDRFILSKFKLLQRWSPKPITAIHNVNIKRFVVAFISIYFLTIIVAESSRFLPVFKGGVLQQVTKYPRQWGIANTYGLFSIMTKKRYEIVIEGSMDGELWEPYVFKYKPGLNSTGLTWMQPHQPRLDWQMWFASLNSYHSQYWFQVLLNKLLKGEVSSQWLFHTIPFYGKPPNYIRSQMYRFEFSTYTDYKINGDFWRSTYFKPYSPVMTLNK